MWRERVIKDYGEHEDASALNESQIVDKYGTTVLFAVITDKKYILGQLGDGAILMCNNDGQYQLFSRLRKTSPTTRSMASSTAEFSLITGVFSRDMFNILLLSTDGIYDVFSKNAYFLLYGQELVRQAEEYQELLSPFTVRDPFQKEYIELSEETTDDCTIALAISGRLCRQYADILLQRYFPEKVSFSRAVNGAEFYDIYVGETYYDIHVLDEGVFLADSKPDFYSCEILDPVDYGKLETGYGRSIFIYKRPAGFVSIQVLLDRYKHLEKRYELDDAEDEEKDISGRERTPHKCRAAASLLGRRPNEHLEAHCLKASAPMRTAFNATKLATGACIVPYIFAFTPAMLIVSDVAGLVLVGFRGKCAVHEGQA